MQAQTEKAAPKYAISAEPFYLINGGLRLNMEKKLQSNDWVELNLTGYWLPHSDILPNSYRWEDRGGYLIPNADFNRISGLSGLGIGATYKHYLSSFFLVNPAISYTWYNVENAAYDFLPYKEDGLTFYDYVWTYTNQPFHKLSMQVTLGFRTSPKHLFFLENYLGLGYAHSFYDKNKSNYTETMFGYGYRGPYLTLGVKLGFNLR
jgi:hypothetical protein